MIFSPGLVTELVAGHGGSVDGVWLAGVWQCQRGEESRGLSAFAQVAAEFNRYVRENSARHATLS